MFCKVLRILFLFSLSVFYCNARDPLPDQSDILFLQDCLNTTNGYRQLHHAQNLLIDLNAVLYAMSRCSLISQYEGLSYGHQGLVGYGENLFWGASFSNTPWSCKEPIDWWYNEVNRYDFSRPGYGFETGHFTQLVWRGTTGVGCARCGGRGSQWYETYIVCNYTPAGNIATAEHFMDNVLPK